MHVAQLSPVSLADLLINHNMMSLSTTMAAAQQHLYSMLDAGFTRSPTQSVMTTEAKSTTQRELSDAALFCQGYMPVPWPHGRHPTGAVAIWYYPRDAATPVCSTVCLWPVTIVCSLRECQHSCKLHIFSSATQP